MLKQLLFVALALVSSNLYAQKMNVLDYFKAFTSNTKSPNNQLNKAAKELSITNSGIANEYIVAYYAEQKFKSKVTHDVKNNYLTYKRDFFEGWNGGKCYPTFKVYTKANGQQVLGVTEDSYTHHGYKSKYRPAQGDLMDIMEYGNEVCPMYQWNQRPKPIKFWTYEGGNWTEVTDEVMSEFFTLEQLIAKTTTSSADIQEEIIGLIYPLYRIEADKDEITVWVDGERHMLYTTEIEKFANPADNLTSRQKGLPVYWDYVRNTTYKSYTLVWDAKAGQFVRKK